MGSGRLLVTSCKYFPLERGPAPILDTLLEGATIEGRLGTPSASGPVLLSPDSPDILDRSLLSGMSNGSDVSSTRSDIIPFFELISGLKQCGTSRE